MATSSIKAPIRVTSVEGARALCEAYEKGLAMDASIKSPKRLTGDGYQLRSKKQSINCSPKWVFRHGSGRIFVI